ncbi:MAG: hypothetical protein ACK5HR_06565 [Mycoplasmatales bacterium]
MDNNEIFEIMTKLKDKTETLELENKKLEEDNLSLTQDLEKLQESNDNIFKNKLLLYFYGSLIVIVILQILIVIFK